MDSKHRPGFLYVASWEVCNREGGVHTVLSSSAPFLEAAYGEGLLYVGPDLWANRAVQTAFQPDPIQPDVARFALERDVPTRFGRWMIEGRPRVALVDFGRLLERKNDLLGDLWEEHGVDSLHADWDDIERILFGYAAGLLIELHYHAQVRPTGRRAVAHFHQWLSGAGLLRLHERAPEIGTVYQPHGTRLGRTLAATATQVAKGMEGIDPLAAAREHGVLTPHTLDVAAAGAASVLVDVSEHAAEEARHILGRAADLVAPNGFTATTRVDPDRRAEVRASVFRAAERFLGAPLDRDATRLVFSSGPYQVHNKGIDIALRALGRLRARGDALPRPLLYLVAMPAQQTGPRPEVLRRLKAGALEREPLGVCTHNLSHAEDDPLLDLCGSVGLGNEPGDKVHVVFVPVFLDGTDPVLPHTYAEVLAASDLTLFPSLYEPWGYTPVESLAAGVPTVTTDLTGFGRFAQRLPEEERRALTVLPRSGESDAASVEHLENHLLSFLALGDEELAAQRRASDVILARTTWDKLIEGTLDAHRRALAHAAARKGKVPAPPPMAPLTRRSVIVLPTTGGDRPQLHSFTVQARLPDRLARLRELASNLWWCWHPGAGSLFDTVDPEGWAAAEGNPIRLLRNVDPGRLLELAEDDAFLARLDAVLATFDADINRTPADAPATTYFCAEFGLHESVPIYSGGLGVLAGDHLKAASDLALPLSAVGLRYAHGYFVQRIQPGGDQGAEFRLTELRDQPMSEARGPDGTPLRVVIPMPERDLHAAVYVLPVGRVPVYLLDTRVPENDPADQDTTYRLYPSDREHRLRQEILLGMGGWLALGMLSRRPVICHLNEGHSAFLLLQRLLELVEQRGLTFAEATEVVRASTVFTTHTPVPAGHDRFSEGLMRRYFGHVANRLGLDWDEFLDLGRESRQENEFSMTVLALRLCGRANGVSKLHGGVSRQMLQGVWPGFHQEEAPVDSITNGVHLPTWVGPEIRALLDDCLGPEWAARHPDADGWSAVEGVDPARLWGARRAQKRRMVDFLRARVEEAGLRRGESAGPLQDRLEALDPDALWIGYARRFAPYKRATLLFRDPDRLAKLLEDEERPVRIVFSGKAHPDDHQGAQLVREVVELTRDPRFAGRLFFVEDYGIGVARMLVQGCDVWLNTPTRPLEASGTSGMKAGLNGGLHASILDGWWCESFDGENGWAIGEGREYDNPEMQAEHDSRSLYAILEDELVPLYFERDGDGRPVGWLERSRHAIASIPPVFNTERMVSDYAQFAYRPLGEESSRLEAEEFAGARERSRRHARLRELWPQVRIEKVSVSDLSEGAIGVGETFEVHARVRTGALAPEELSVELFIGPVDERGALRDPLRIELMHGGNAENGSVDYTGSYLPRGSGTFRYGVRVLPRCDDFEEAARLGLVCWA